MQTGKSGLQSDPYDSVNSMYCNKRFYSNKATCRRKLFFKMYIRNMFQSDPVSILKIF